MKPPAPQTAIGSCLLTPPALLSLCVIVFLFGNESARGKDFDVILHNRMAKLPCQSPHNVKLRFVCCHGRNAASRVAGRLFGP